MSLLLELLVLLSEGGQACSTDLRQMFQTLFTPFEHPLTFGQFRILDRLFCVPMIGIKFKRDEPVSKVVFLSDPSLIDGLGVLVIFPYLTHVIPTIPSPSPSPLRALTRLTNAI